VTWAPNQVSFLSAAATGSIINQWTFTPASTAVPTPGDVHLHLNLYVSRGSAPAVPVPQEVVISGFQYTPSGPQIGFRRTSDTVPFLSGQSTVPLDATGASCSAMIESDSPWIQVSGLNPIPAGGSLQYTAADNLGLPRTGHLILESTTCNPAPGAQVLTVTQSGLVCSPSFAAPSTHVGFVPSARSVLIRGTASTCTWTVTSASPWLKVVSTPSGFGDGSVQFSADANNDPALRQSWLALDNGKQHFVYQDAAGGFFAISPAASSPCSGRPAQFAVSWVAPVEVEIHLNSATGNLVGHFAESGSTLLPQVADGTLIYLVSADGSNPPTVLATARAAVSTANCSAPAIAPLGVVNGASYSSVSLAPGSLATVFGTNLSPAIAQAPPGSVIGGLGGANIMLSGLPCLASYVSPTQINFLVPSELAPGRYLLTAGTAVSEVIVTGVSPGIFTLKGDGTGVPLAAAAGVTKDGTTVDLPPYQCSQSGCSMVPISLPDNLAELYITLYGTGIRNVRNINAVVGSVPAEVIFVGPQSQFPGLDQVNLHLTNTTGLTGIVPLRLKVDGIYSNSVSLQFR
jgi:uncharacterized protein (TIGR03437 family)